MLNYLECKTISSIIDDDHVLDPPVDDPEILDINTLLGLNTAFPEESVLNMLSLGVEVV